MMTVQMNRMKLYINEKTRRVWIKTCTQLIELTVLSVIDIEFDKCGKKLCFDFDLGRIETHDFIIVDYDLA